MRATEGPVLLGVTRVDVDSYSSTLTTELLGIADEQLKTAHFNIEGHRKATAASKEPMAAMPEVDWHAISTLRARGLRAILLDPAIRVGLARPEN